MFVFFSLSLQFACGHRAGIGYLNEHALNKIARTHTLLRVLIVRLDRLGGVQMAGALGEVFAGAFAMRTNTAAKFRL